VKDAVTSFRPGHQRELVVDPSTFDETGFVQPTALIGSFWPLGFLAGFEGLATAMAGWVRDHDWFAPGRGFIYRLDALLFYLGVAPTVLAVAFGLGGGRRRERLWWSGMTIAMFLVSLQQTGLYLWLFHLPFFDVFRAYFLYVTLAVLGV